MKGLLVCLFSAFLAFGLAYCGNGNGGGDDLGQDDTIDIPQEQELEITPDIPTEEIIEVVPDPDPAEEIPADVPVEDTTIDWTPGEGLVGDACEDVDDCQGYPAAAKECMQDILGYVELPNGYCSGQCTSPAECGEGATCVSLFITSFCIRTCDDNSDCRVDEGYECGTIPMVEGTYCIVPFGGPETTDF